MTITISITDLKNLFAEAAELGAAALQRKLEPDSDFVSQRDVKNFLRRIGQDPESLKKMVEDGLVHPERTGAAVNSKIVYSKIEILEAISAINLQKKLLNIK